MAAPVTPENAAMVEALTAEVKRLRRALRKIADYSNPDRVENCHEVWVIAQEALGD